MTDTFYKLGYSLMYAIPFFIALLLIARIRKNRQEIKRLEELRKKEKSREEAARMFRERYRDDGNDDPSPER